MIKKLAYLIASLGVVVCGGATLIAQPVSAAGCPDAYVFGIPAWYNHLGGAGAKADGCSVELPQKDGKPDVARTVTIIALNVVQALMVVVAYVAVFFLIKGGLNYIYGSGSPDSIQSAKQTIQNAVIGMIIAALSAGIVNAIAGAIK